MTRWLGVALLLGGVSWTAFAQETFEPPPSEQPSDETDLGREPADPGFDATGPGEADPAIDPATDADAVRPGEPLEGVEPAEPGLPGSPIPGARGRNVPDPETLPDTILDSTPVPANDLPPAAGDPRLPIERQPLPADPDLSEPLVPDVEIFPPTRRRPVIDPAYTAPAPPRPRPRIELDEIVRNPVRVYEARLAVLRGAGPCSGTDLDVLARRFPTDARVPYLRYFHLSRTGQPDAALGALQQAVAMERLYPVTDYNRFMEPLQGADRFYLERVRRATAELAAADGLVEPVPEDVVPALEDAPPVESGRGAAPGIAPITPDAAERTAPRDPLEDHLPDAPSDPADPRPGLNGDAVPPDEDVPNG